MQNNLTPLAIVLYIFALCTSYMFISLNASKYNYAGDYKFILFKMQILISTIALGFFITLFSCFIYALPFQSIKNFDITRNHLVQTFLLYFSSVWMALAVALLPFGHTVYNMENGAVDKDLSTQLNIMHQVVYSGPYYAFMVLFSVMLFVAFIAIGHTYNHTPWKYVEGGSSNNGSIRNIFKVFKYALGVRSTFGFYFRLDPDKYEKMVNELGQGSTAGQDTYE